MPELPDVRLYVARLSERLVGQCVKEFKISSPFVLRSTGVPVSELIGAELLGVSRSGKRIVFSFDRDLYLIVHLMIAGRFVWDEAASLSSSEGGAAKRPPKIELFRILWTSGRLSLIEASGKKRAGIWLVRGFAQVEGHRRGGLDIFEATAEEFRDRLCAANRTLKRALTDPSSFDGIGNAYSDEILFRARLSPLRLSQSLSKDEVTQLWEAARSVLSEWTQKLLHDIPNFPKPAQVTAFRKEFYVHGKFGEPCRVCGAKIQRIVGSENEMNYCARCQNNGRILADRSLSRLLKDDWPGTIDELTSEE